MPSRRTPPPAQGVMATSDDKGSCSSKAPSYQVTATMTGTPTTPSYSSTNGTKTAQIRKPRQYYLPKVTGLVEDTMRSKLCSSCLQNARGQPQHRASQVLTPSGLS